MQEESSTQHAAHQKEHFAKSVVKIPSAKNMKLKSHVEVARGPVLPSAETKTACIKTILKR